MGAYQWHGCSVNAGWAEDKQKWNGGIGDRNKTPTEIDVKSQEVAQQDHGH